MSAVGSLPFAYSASSTLRSCQLVRAGSSPCWTLSGQRMPIAFLTTVDVEHRREQGECFPLAIGGVFAESHYAAALANIRFQRQMGGYALDLANTVNRRDSRSPKRSGIVQSDGSEPTFFRVRSQKREHGIGFLQGVYRTEESPLTSSVLAKETKTRCLTMKRSHPR